MPVSPRITAPLIHPPLGVASKRLPSLSTTEMWVVSLDMPAESRPSEASWSSRDDDAWGELSETLAFQYGQVLTCESYFMGSPAIKTFEACFGSMSAARSLA